MILASTKGELFRIEERSASRAYSSEKSLGAGKRGRTHVCMEKPPRWIKICVKTEFAGQWPLGFFLL